MATHTSKGRNLFFYLSCIGYVNDSLEMSVLVVISSNLSHWIFLMLPWVSPHLLTPSLAASAKLTSPPPALVNQRNLLQHFWFQGRWWLPDLFILFCFKRNEKNIPHTLEEGEVCIDYFPCYFIFLLTIGISLPGVRTSTFPNKDRYLLLNSFISEEACRLLFLVIIITMEKFPLREM